MPWLPGENATAASLDLGGAAVDLAAFITALHSVSAAGGPVRQGTARGVPLPARDEITRAAIDELGSRVDAGRVTAGWERALSASGWEPAGVWIHGDLQAGNLLVTERRLSAVIDFGGLGVGDPAADLLPAWNLFDVPSRGTFREALHYDDDTWERGRGWALTTALVALPYYWDSALPIRAQSDATIAAVIAESP